MHTVTFSHGFLLFGSKLEFPWDCGTIQSHAKTLPCARSLSFDPLVCSNAGSIRDDPYWTSTKNSLELIELSGINEINLVRFLPVATLEE